MLRRIWKNVGFSAMLFLLLMAGAMSSYAGTWKQNGTQWSYDNGDGTILKNGWYWIDGNYDGVAECYYFDANGIMAAGKVIDGYRVNSDGAWVVNGQVQNKSSISPDMEVLKTYEKVEGGIGIYCDDKDVIDCGNYYELKNIDIILVRNGEPEFVKTNFTVYMSKAVDIEWYAGEGQCIHKNFNQYCGVNWNGDIYRTIRFLGVEFDSNGWIIEGFDMDAN